MVAAIAASGAAAAAAAAANAARIARERRDCEAFMPRFQDAGTSLRQKHYYAQCVDRFVYDPDASHSDIGFILFVTIVAAMLVAGIVILLTR